MRLCPQKRNTTESRPKDATFIQDIREKKEKKKLKPFFPPFNFTRLSFKPLVYVCASLPLPRHKFTPLKLWSALWHRAFNVYTRNSRARSRVRGPKCEEAGWSCFTIFYDAFGAVSPFFPPRLSSPGRALLFSFTITL